MNGEISDAVANGVLAVMWRDRALKAESDLVAANATIEAERAAHRATEQERIDEAVNATVAEHDLQEARATIDAQALVLSQYREALETMADLAQFVLDRITNGVTSDERLVMKDTARIAMDKYRILATPPTAAVDQAAAVLKAGEALEDAANRHYWAYEDFDGEDDPRWRQVHDALAIAEGAYRRAKLALRGAGSGEPHKNDADTQE